MTAMQVLSGVVVLLILNSSCGKKHNVSENEVKLVLDTVEDVSIHSNKVDFDGGSQEKQLVVSGSPGTLPTDSGSTALTTELPTASTDKTTICNDLDPPLPSNATVTNSSIAINWNVPPEDKNECQLVLSVECISLDNYTWVVRTGSTTVSVPPEDSLVASTVDHLSSFTKYNCTGLLSSKLSSASSNVSSILATTDEGVPSEPQNVRVLHIKSTEFTIAWNEPAIASGHIQYVVKVDPVGPNHYIEADCDKTKTSEFIVKDFNCTFNDGLPDYNYNISVTAYTSGGYGNTSTISITTNISESEPPRNVSYNIDNTDLVINWEMPCNTNGPVDSFLLEMTGKYLEDNTLDHRKEYVNITNENAFSFTIPNIWPETVYNVSLRAVSASSRVNGNAATFNFTSEAALPEKPVLDKDPQLSNDSFNVIWNRPSGRAGIIRTYTISITCNGPAFIKSPDCKYSEGDTKSEIFDGKVTNYFMEALPYHNYTVKLYANTSKGQGPYNEISFVTLPSESEEPRRLEESLVDYSTNYSNYNVTAMLTWALPCNINGPLEKFEITLQGEYTEDQNYTDSKKLNVARNGSQLNYLYDIYDLKASFQYILSVRVITNKILSGKEAKLNIATPVGLPGYPLLKSPMFSNGDMIIEWSSPIEKRGPILYYTVNVTSKGPVKIFNKNCLYDFNTYNFNITEGWNRLRFIKTKRYFNYDVSVVACTEKGNGPVSNTMVTTPNAKPENVENITQGTIDAETELYNVSSIITFQPPCFVNGNVTKYSVTYKGLNKHRERNFGNANCTDNEYIFCTFQMQPEYNYTVDITVMNEVGNSSSPLENIVAPAGVPKVPSNLSITPPEIKENAMVEIVLKKEYFNTENGDIKYLALIISSENITGGEFRKWNSNNWPLPNSPANIYYQVTETYWNPFKDDVSEVKIRVGNDTSCNYTDLFCNRPLEEGTQYFLIIRAFTENYYRNFPCIEFTTAYSSKLGLILGLVLGLVLIATACFIIFWHIRIRKLLRIKENILKRAAAIQQDFENCTSIPVCKFVEYCKILESNYDKLKIQYDLLNEKSKEIHNAQSITYALLPENRRKNRYVNILPYDETRVKLMIEEDDEISSDYVNASYIKGFSESNEYIATQGPLPTTCKDFWRMVIQENVSIIVMVSQFIEQSKEKCHKYFPDNHESMQIDDNMQVRCSTELNYGTYCVRYLQVTKNDIQRTVIHMQYLDWPDFGVPAGTENMLHFCCQLRERLKTERALMVVHCSAGVGRTGTLIATDILLQKLKSGRNIDVFNTVLELRKQRGNMVQTEKQYMYIHNLIRNMIENPMTSEAEEPSEPAYQNMSVLKSYTEKELLKSIETEF